MARRGASSTPESAPDNQDRVGMTGTAHPIRFLTLAIAALVAVALITPVPAQASRSRVEQLRAELNEINDEFKRAGAAYDKAFWALDETEAAIEKTSGRIGDNEVALAEAQDQLQDRMASWYRSDDLGLVGFLVAADDFEDFVTRMDYASRIAAADASAIERVETLLAQLRKDRARLETEKQQRAEDLGRFKTERDALQRQLASKRSEYDRVQRALAEAARREEAARQRLQAGAVVPMRSDASAVAGPNGMVFPVAGPHYYSDTWGASRDGGRRRHRGTDVMAPTGTPVVATLAGTVSRGDGARSGLMIRLVAANGWEFYYMHLDRILVGSGRVSPGQVIGTVGYTGNASASAPHLHFEIHIPGRGAVNPYSYLRQMQGR
ncbi:MAG TPA: peptidoglycan DD-metalloendopeptidase family protein [Coriobacteriia bacterium]|nr:peptidoglycan DD-metalloendopeptidase family protein [Coriobacteriia bacterium]